MSDKHTITLDLSDHDLQLLSLNSVERVINTSMRLTLRRYNSKDEDWAINHDDWKELKDLVCRLWWMAREAKKVREEG
jgi:hypothetical protein